MNTVNLHHAISNKELLIAAAYTNGDWLSVTQTASHFDVINPATGDRLAEIPVVSSEQLHSCIQAASTAQHEWAKHTAQQRAEVLHLWHSLIQANASDLATIVTAEMGKPLAEAKGEVAYAARFVEWYAEEAKRIYGDVIPSHASDKRIVVLKQPMGVVAAITPWNFPLAMITRKVAPALAAGCSVVVKPAEQTPLSAIALLRLAEQAGFPKGVCNLITTDQPQAIGALLCAHPDIRVLTFTGSTQVGSELTQQAAGTLKKVILELGGNAAFIVFEDADIDAAIDGAIASKFRNAGQTCVCSNRLFVHRSIYQRFTKALCARVAQLRVGDGFARDTDIGPLINQQGFDKVQTLLNEAVQEGARIACGGAPHPLGGTFFHPTVLTEVTDSMAIAQQEVFGPVAPLFVFDSEAEVIDRANATSSGLAAYFYTRDLARSWRVAEQLETGMVGINAGLLSTEVAPFGGIKASGHGREGSYYGIEEYVHTKYLCIGI